LLKTKDTRTMKAIEIIIDVLEILSKTAKLAPVNLLTRYNTDKIDDPATKNSSIFNVPLLLIVLDR
jgi:hypothetical protein